MKSLKEETIINFVYENYSEETPKKIIELSKAQKKMVKYFLKRSLGPNDDGLVGILKDGEGCLVIDKKGHIFGPS